MNEESKSLESDDHYVAIKKTKMRRMDYLKHSFNFSTYREIMHLQELEHENIIRLKDVFYKDKNIYVVLEYMVSDLTERPETPYTDAQIKCIIHQILSGLKYMHDWNMMHRDLKPGNLLISSQGEVKYSDFGLARYFYQEEVKNPANEDAKLTRNVCTRYYRPPEILYGSYEYDFSVDVWSAGCILGELAINQFLFKGENEIDQLGKIFSILGNANEETWPGVQSLPNYIEFDCEVKQDLGSLFSDQSDEFRDLISKMVVLDPSKRIKVNEALNHPYFMAKPLMWDPIKIPLPDVKTEELDMFTDSD